MRNRALPTLLSAIILAGCATTGGTGPSAHTEKERERLVRNAVKNRTWLGLSKGQLEHRLKALGFGPRFDYGKSAACFPGEEELAVRLGTLEATASRTTEKGVEKTKEPAFTELRVRLKNGRVTNAVVVLVLIDDSDSLAIPDGPSKTRSDLAHAFVRDLCGNPKLFDRIDRAIREKAWLGLNKKEMEDRLKALDLGPEFKWRPGSGGEELLCPVARPNLDSPNTMQWKLSLLITAHDGKVVDVMWLATPF